jgi:hypothetical protein
MSTQFAANRTTLYKVGWFTLLVLAVLFSVWHIALTFMDNDPLLIAWVAFPLYAAVVLYLPFRRGEKWAWYASWILVLGFASPILFQTTFGVYYLGTAVVMALALLLTRPAFFQKGSGG